MLFPSSGLKSKAFNFGIPSSTLKMEDVCTYESSVNFYGTTRRHFAEIVASIVTVVRTLTPTLETTEISYIRL
jgi:hypothetical protein